MGLVKVDIHKAERPFHQVTFSDIDCIKGLIVGRSHIDPYRGEGYNFNIYEAGNVKPLNQELICIYADLDTLIKKVKLNEKQSNIINMLMDGYDVNDVAEYYNNTRQAIEYTLNTVADKIKKENYLSWKYDDMYLNYKNVKWEYKKCSKCGELLPKNEEFFNKNEKIKDGYHSYCKKCNK